jgi:hypothetical protein
VVEHDIDEELPETVVGQVEDALRYKDVFTQSNLRQAWLPISDSIMGSRMKKEEMFSGTLPLKSSRSKRLWILILSSSSDLSERHPCISS